MAAVVSFASVMEGLLREDSGHDYDDTQIQQTQIHQVTLPCHEEGPTTKHEEESGTTSWIMELVTAAVPQPQGAELAAATQRANLVAAPQCANLVAVPQDVNLAAVPQDVNLAAVPQDTEDSSSTGGTTLRSTEDPEDMSQQQTAQFPLGISPELARLPRWNEILPNLNCFPIEFRLPTIGSTTGGILQHGHRRLELLRARHPHVFKIGITCHPVQRWAYATYAYRRDTEGWHGMLVIYATESAIAAAFLEAHMIYVYKDTHGCRNVRTGGDSSCVSADGPHFTYIVYKSLAKPCD
jgi:hypothetical protein